MPEYSHLIAVSNTLFFQANDGSSGYELWKSDGTIAGTARVADIRTGIASSYPRDFTAVGNIIFFQANDNNNGRELWMTDGTSTGTMRVADIIPGEDYLFYRIAFGSTLFLQADDGKTGLELWKTDGTTTGTVLVADISPTGSSRPREFTAIGNTIFFTARDSSNGKGNELWKTDGTAAGTMLVADIRPGDYGSVPISLTAFGNTLIFQANDGINGRELWKSDGTAAGTVRIADINPGAASSSYSYFTAIGSTLFFRADDGTTGYELWKTDGTAAGTVRVADIYQGGATSYFGDLTAVGNILFFRADDGTTGSELWKTDGTAAGTVRVADINPGSASSRPRYLTAVGNTLFFQADDGTSGIELWRSDGTAAGTVRVADINPGNADSYPSFLTAVGNTLFFRANDGSSGYELWALDVNDTPPPPPELAIARASTDKTEGFAGFTPFTFTVTRTGDLSVASSAQWAVAGTGTNPAGAADFQAAALPSGTVTFAQEESTKTITVNVAGDTFVEADETFAVLLSNPLGATLAAGSSSAIGTIRNDDTSSDRTAPLLNTITVEGSQLMLGFSEAILTPGLGVDRFAVKVAGAIRAVTAISPGATSSQLQLTLAGAAPTASQSVRVRYTDLTSGANDERGVVQDAAGNDLATIAPPGRAADTFRSAASVTALAATTTNLVLTGSRAINGTGNALANTITGNGAANTLNGATGADRLIGGGGNDTLSGGLGADIFRFDAALSSTTNRDTITDFNAAQGDRIQLENAVFRGLTRTGTLAATAFRSGRSFTSTAQRILYNPATGNLSYDSNGSARGGISALIATLTTRPALSSSMLVVT